MSSSPFTHTRTPQAQRREAREGGHHLIRVGPEPENVCVTNAPISRRGPDMGTERGTALLQQSACHVPYASEEGTICVAFAVSALSL